jgi:hypothetical protein
VQRRKQQSLLLLGDWGGFSNRKTKRIRTFERSGGENPLRQISSCTKHYFRHIQTDSSEATTGGQLLLIHRFCSPRKEVAIRKEFGKTNQPKKSRFRRGDSAIYQELLLLNFHALAISKILNDLGRLRALPKNEAAYYASMVEEVRASASQSIVENMNALEIFRAADASKFRQRLEKELLGSDE